MNTNLVKRIAGPLLFLLGLAVPSVCHAQSANDKIRAEVASAAKAEGLELARSVNQFALELYQKAAKGTKDNGNFVIAPYGIAESLGLAYVGARGDTAAQMAKTLHWSLKPEQVGPAFASLGIGAGGRFAEPVRVPNHRFGVRVRDADGAGVEIVEVKKNSPAEAAKLKVKDRITWLGDWSIRNSADFANASDHFTDVISGEVIASATGKPRPFTATLNPSAGSKRFRPAIANGFWGRKGIEFKPAFKEAAALYFDAAAQSVDFAADPKAAQLHINQWVADRTDGSIQLLPAGAVAKDTALILTNAIFFQADWLEPFNPKFTKSEYFYTAPDKKIAVSMMHKREQYRFYKEESFRVLEMPYVGDFSMVLFLPTKRSGLPEFESKHFLAGNVVDWLKKSTEKRVDVSLPRFKIGAELDVKPALSELGMPLAFGKSADFSGMTKDDKLALSQVLHKAEINLDEKGTRASAGSATMAVVLDKATEEFVADHPFLFLIRDTRKGVILFVGRVASPAEK